MKEVRILKSRTNEGQGMEMKFDLQTGLSDIIKNIDPNAVDNEGTGIHDDDGVTFFCDYLQEKKFSAIGVVTLDMNGFDPDSTFSDHGIDVLDYSMIPVRTRDLQTEWYLSDVVSNCVSDELDQIIDYDNNDDYEPGIYRIVFGVEICSTSYSTEYGTEYEEEYYIEVLSKIRYAYQDEREIIQSFKRDEEYAREQHAADNRLDYYEHLDREGFFDRLREEGHLPFDKPKFRR